ncbi:MAG: ROK family protein [Candidatus Levybacteria bacterium]|nr:ROK family protein [Candidatus Levybacteria bacterium]
MARLTYQQLIDKHLEILKGLQYDTGLFAAADKTVGTGYEKSWLRDNFYETIAFEVIGDWDTVEATYEAILQILIKHESKLDWAIENKPTESFQYIHARFHPETFEEFWESWGNKQNDAVGCILFRIGELEANQNRSILKDEAHIRVVNKLVKYLEAIEYWQDRDSGMWEEDEELHASSVGACVAGLRSISRLPQVDVSLELIKRGEEALNALLPRESDRKFVDLSLLSLIWPYNVATKEQADTILENVEYHLLRERGVIRYKGDAYYNKNTDFHSEEAEWTFGLAWLAIIYEKRGEKDKAFSYIKDLIAVDTPDGIPELYFSNSPDYNDNTPLGWSESLFVVALNEIERRNISESDENEYLANRPLLSISEEQLSWINSENVHQKIVGEFNLKQAEEILRDSEEKMAYAVDMGGDKIVAQVFKAANGRMSAVGEIMMSKSNGGKGYVAFLEEVANQALKKSVPVGLSIAGPIEGTVLHSGPNLQLFADEFELIYQSDFAKLFDHPTADNDAVSGLKAGAVESLLHFPQVKNVLYIIAGSGFGAAILKDNQIYALEPGHVAITDDMNIFGIEQACGVFGNDKPCIEKVASGKAGIEATYEKVTGLKKAGHAISDLARKGDDLALNLYDNSARMVSHVVKALGIMHGLFENPSEVSVVFHGGVFNVPGYTNRLEQYLSRDIDKSLQLLYTKSMGNNACLEGAAIAAMA